MKNIKEGDKVIILPYDDSRLCPPIDAAIKAKEAFKVKEFHKKGTHKRYSESVVIVNIGGKDRLFGEEEVIKKIENK